MAFPKQKYAPQAGIVHRQVKKALPYSVNVIGDRRDLARWRLERAEHEAREAQRSAERYERYERYERRRERAIEIVMSEPRYWTQRLIDNPPVPKPFFARVKGACREFVAKVWRFAFPS